MIVVDVTDQERVTRFTINRATQTIVSDDPAAGSDTIPDTVTEILETGDLIGPQVDEFTGAVGSWDHPINVVAAFFDAAEEVGAEVGFFDLSGDPAADDLMWDGP